jgi:hypothetical protein
MHGPILLDLALTDATVPMISHIRVVSVRSECRTVDFGWPFHMLSGARASPVVYLSGYTQSIQGEFMDIGGMSRFWAMTLT